jgi:hypothetical protein
VLGEKVEARASTRLATGTPGTVDAIPVRLELHGVWMRYVRFSLFLFGKLAIFIDVYGLGKGALSQLVYQLSLADQYLIDRGRKGKLVDKFIVYNVCSICLTLLSLLSDSLSGRSGEGKVASHRHRYCAFGLRTHHRPAARGRLLQQAPLRGGHGFDTQMHPQSSCVCDIVYLLSICFS